MGGPWRERAVDSRTRPAPVPVPRALVQKARVASEAVTAATVGFVVALVTSLGVSIACFAFLR